MCKLRTFLIHECHYWGYKEGIVPILIFRPIFISRYFPLNTFNQLHPTQPPHILPCQVRIFDRYKYRCTSACPYLDVWPVWVQQDPSHNRFPCSSSVNLLFLLLIYVMVIWPSLPSRSGSFSMLSEPHFPSTSNESISPHSWTWFLKLVKVCLLFPLKKHFTPLPFYCMHPLQFLLPTFA